MATLAGKQTPLDIAAGQPGWSASGSGNQANPLSETPSIQPSVVLPSDVVANGSFYKLNPNAPLGIGTSLATEGINSATTTVNTNLGPAPSSGQVLTATGLSAATWQDATGGSGGGISPPAGDIGGTIGSPTVVATHLASALPTAQGGTGNTSGNAPTATTASALTSATTTVAVSSATAPSSGQVLTATSSTAATWQTPSGGGGNATTGAGPSTAGLGLILQSNDPGSMGSTSLIAAPNLLYMSLVTAGASGTITKLGTVLSGGGSTPGAGVNGLAIYSEAGALLANTASLTTAFEGTGLVEASISSVSIVAGTNYYLCFQSCFATNTLDVMTGNGFLDFEAGSINGHVLCLGFFSSTTWPSTVTVSSAAAGSHRPYVYAR